MCPMENLGNYVDDDLRISFQNDVVEVIVYCFLCASEEASHFSDIVCVFPNETCHKAKDLVV